MEQQQFVSFAKLDGTIIRLDNQFATVAMKDDFLHQDSPNVKRAVLVNMQQIQQQLAARNV